MKMVTQNLLKNGNEMEKNGKEAKIQVLINNLEEVLLKSIRDEKRCQRAGDTTRSKMNKRKVDIVRERKGW